MTQAQHIHQELLRALHALIPRTIYQDRRRLDTLAWAVTGITLRESVHLSAWAQVTESRAQTAASRIQRFSAWLHNPALAPFEWYRPVIQAALSAWPPVQPLFVALDTTMRAPFALIRASLISRGRAIPLAWRVLRHQSAMVAFSAYQPVLEQVASLGRGQIVVLADRGFANAPLLEELRQLGFQFRLRLPRNTLVHLRGSQVVAVKQLCPPAGSKRFVQQVCLFGTAFGPVSLALATPLEQPDGPWFVVSSEPTTASTLAEYALRFDVEEGFRDEKAGGFQLQKSRLTDPLALERLLLIVALSTLYLTSLGASVERAGERRLVDPHWQRRLSYLQLGARWLRQQEQRDWQPVAPFWLDPAPDPCPVLPSRRFVFVERPLTGFPMVA